MRTLTELLEDRPQSSGEEIANSISHGVGAIAALTGAPFLILAAVRKGDPILDVGVSIFAASMVLLYLTSMIYHFLPQGRAKRLFLIFDHIAIFLLIAGTYTPFALSVLPSLLGKAFLALIWLIGLLGIITKLIPKLRYSKLSLLLYLVMGWMAVLVIWPLYQNLPFHGFLWLVAGGLAYTGGVIFFLAKPRYSHFVWHLFTMAGTTCHFFAILWYAS
jgi:hemolysin III